MAVPIVILVVYLVGVTGQWSPTPDSALYQGLGRSLARGEGYVFNGATSTHVTPGYPLILAGLRFAFGDGYWAPNALAAVSGMMALLLAYWVFRRMGHPRLALSAVFITAMSYTFYNNAHRILTDAPFAVVLWGVVAILTCRERLTIGSAATVGVLAVIGILIRAPGGLALGSLAIGIALNRASGVRKQSLIYAGVLLLACAVTAGGLLWLAQWVSDETPLYVTRSIGNPDKTLWGRVAQLGVMVIRLPGAYAEMFTSQDGLAIPVGIPGVALAAAGGMVLWRRGERLLPTTVGVYIVSLCLIKDSDSVRPRHLMSVQPMIAYLSLIGLSWVVGASARRRSIDDTCRRRSTAIAVFVVVCAGISFPRHARNAFYYSYAAHTGRYYQTIRDRAFVDFPDLERVVREAGGVDAVVAASENQVSILSFLTERVIVDAFPEPTWPVEDDLAAVAGVAEMDPRPGSIVIDFSSVAEGPRRDAYLRGVNEILVRDHGSVQVFGGESFAVYAWPDRSARPP